MATTAIIPLHINKGKTAGKCIKERLDYIMNPGKTQGGTLVSSHACAPETAANEFMLLRMPIWRTQADPFRARSSGIMSGNPSSLEKLRRSWLSIPREIAQHDRSN